MKFCAHFSSLAALATALAGGAAHGQESSAAVAPATASEETASSPTQEIVVTAQRRSEQLREVPATINVTTGSNLSAANINNSLEFGQLVPAVQIVTLGNYSQPAVRGITTQVVGVGNPPNVALYIDGIYITAQDAYNFDFLGIERIETLKGPQGTLYGRNATGGAILVTTKKPSFTFGGNASVSYGNLDTKIAKIYLTGPINDKLAVSVAAQYKADDGYMFNITTGHHIGKNRSESVRGKMLFKPSDTVEFQLSVDHSYFNNPIGYDSSTLNGNSVATQTPGVVIATKPYQVSMTIDPINYNKQTGAALRGDIDLGSVSLTTLTSYRKLTSYADADNDYNPLPQNRNQRHASEASFSQEFTLSSHSDGPLSWVVGALYATEDARNDPVIANGVLNVINKVINKAASAYGEATYDITPQLVGVAGVRYSYEHKELNGTYGNPAFLPAKGSRGWDAWTPRFSLRYSPNDDLSVYATYNKGFKSGGYNTNNSNSAQTPPTVANPTSKVVAFEPETVTGYEVGTKTRFSRVVSLDVSAYYYDYKNEQVTAAITTAGVAGTQVLNAASAHIYGAEAELRLRPVTGLNMQIGLAYTHARYANFPNALLTTPRPGGGNIQFVGDASGFRLVRIPDFTGSLAAQYEHELGAGKMFLSGNIFYSSGFYQSFNNRLHQTSYVVANAQIGYSPPGSPLKFSLFAKNITKEIYALMMSDSPTGDRLVYAPPRTYGATIDFSF